MLPFAISIEPGKSPYRQIVYAATKAVVSGELAPGAPFPSVRELSQALKINPNTAQKVLVGLHLVQAGGQPRDDRRLRRAPGHRRFRAVGLRVVQQHPGVGTVVTTKRRASAAERRALLSSDVEALLVEAKRLGLSREDVVTAVEGRWADLFGEE